MADPEVKLHDRVKQRPESTVLQFYITVPPHLKHHFPGKQFVFRGSLKTRDPVEANRKAKLLDAEWERRFAELEELDKALERQSNPERVPVTPELVQKVAQEARRWVLQADDNMRAIPGGPRALLASEERQKLLKAAREAVALGETAGLSALAVPSSLTIGAAEAPTTASTEALEADPLAGLTEEEAGALARWNAAGAAAAAVDSARQNLRAVLPLAESVTRTWGLSADWTSPEGRQGLREVLKVYRQATEEATRKDAGEVVDTPPPALPPAQAQECPQEAAGAPQAAQHGHTPMDAFDAWAEMPGKTGQPRPRKTIEPYKAAAKKLAEHLGGKPLESMTRKDGRDFQALLLQEAQARGGGVSVNTAGTILSRCRTLLNVAIDLEWLDKNPLDGRSINRVKSDRQPWKPAELVKLFDDPVFTAYAVPRASMAGKDAAYWLPLLGLYTGARITELAQLGIDDLHQTEEAGWVLSIHEEGEDQSVKNQHSVRKVPVHPELVRLGLIDYRQAVKDAGAVKLWPGLVFSELNGAGGEFSKWFGKYKAGKGFGPELVFHSFRHTLETELRALSVPKYHIAALAGHAGEDVSDDYAHPTPAVLRPVLERLTFPGLSLPRVFTAPVWKP